MILLKNRLVAFSAVSLCLLGAACDDDDDKTPVVPVTIQGQAEIEAGTYAPERCYKDRLATQTSTQDRFATAEFTMNADGTGALHRRVFSDAACTAQVDEGMVTFEKISVVTVGTTIVLKLEQNGDIIDPTWYVPLMDADNGYFFEVDYTDGDSGPYLFEPSPSEIDEFAQNPAAQGVRFIKQ